MTAEEIKKAWDEEIPVTFTHPNEEPLPNCKITAVIYRKHPKSGRKMVSCEIQDPKCQNCIIIARARELQI